jgi:hypothetical protein
MAGYVKRIVSKAECKDYYNGDVTEEFRKHLITCAIDFMDKHLEHANFATAINAMLTAFMDAMSGLSRELCSNHPNKSVGEKNECFLKDLFRACDKYSAQIVDEVH